MYCLMRIYFLETNGINFTKMFNECSTGYIISISTLPFYSLSFMKPWKLFQLSTNETVDITFLSRMFS